jgi:hypothetical protein
VFDLADVDEFLQDDPTEALGVVEVTQILHLTPAVGYSAILMPQGSELIDNTLARFPVMAQPGLSQCGPRLPDEIFVGSGPVQTRQRFGRW